MPVADYETYCWMLDQARERYAFTRPIVDHLFKDYDGVLKVDGEAWKKGL